VCVCVGVWVCVCVCVCIPLEANIVIKIFFWRLKFWVFAFRKLHTEALAFTVLYFATCIMLLLEGGHKGRSFWF